MAEAAGKPRGNRRLKIALALSLAFNLCIIGVICGVMLRDGPPRGGGRDFGLGPLSEALSHEDRKALRKDFVARHPDIRDARRQMRAEFEAVVAALRADPFDPAALDGALAAIAARNQSLLDTGRELVAERLKAMTAEERAAFADRLEKRVGHKSKG
ncbi:periplasmic heavy metal sensor [Rhodobacter sp. SGA-6-6]|uniref:periplasmic heavy metal sensor n=1 Tax=Rhodobacter sp. SGA-6-6 TaxID=2710882 RepID=UPI0013ECB792|nr:periplasmic heavy metal sensor [Rhodobacter sp. SGA-6-6]NGM46352.1 periplasmic heavy metal sensor [Rhodobacter sp. SGA-6-6]